MKRTTIIVILSILTLFAAMVFPPFQTIAAEKYRVCWSRYVGWEPWGYIAHAGIMAKWAKKYGIEVWVEYVDDYLESINQLTNGTYKACTVTNMDTLNIPAASGVETVALIVGDYSNGNDGLGLRNGKTVKDVAGRTVYLVEGSVSHYLLARALDMNGVPRRAVQMKNVSDREIEAVYLNDRNPKAAFVTWNPMLMRMRNAKATTLVFDSSKIPGEIMDLMVVHANASDSLKKALVGAWYEALATINRGDKASEDAIAYMAQASGATPAEFKAQLKTTKMFWKPEEAVAFTTSPDLKKIMDLVRKFSFEAGLMGQGTKSADQVGVGFPDGSTLGAAKNVKFRFDPSTMKLAANGKL